MKKHTKKPKPNSKIKNKSKSISWLTGPGT